MTNDFLDDPPTSVSPADIRAAHSPDAETPGCANCGHSATGRFCSNCGQRQRGLHQSVGEFVSEAVAGFLSFDSRFWRTLRPLLTKPGHLTKSYLAGHRARYVPPLRLFLFTSFVAFLVLGILWAGSGPTGGPLTINLPEDGPRELTAEERDQVEKQLAELSSPTRWLVRHALVPILEDPARAQEETARRLPIAILFLVPVFAAATRLLFRKQERYFVPHLVFSLHIHTFGLIAVMVGKTGDWITNSGLGLAIMTMVAVAYLFLASLEVFGTGWIWTTIKIAVVTVAYLPVFGLVVLLVAAVTGTSFGR